MISELRRATLIRGLLALIAPWITTDLEAQRPNFLGFRGNMGIEVPRGDPGEVFQGNVRGEFSILVTPRSWHPVYVAIGQGWVAYPVHPGYGIPSGDDEYETEFWNHVALHLGVGADLDGVIPLPLYVEGRLAHMRLRQLRHRDWVGTPSRDQVAYEEFKGWGFAGVIGIERSIAARTWVDLSAHLSQFEPREDLTHPEHYNLVVMDGGLTFGLRLGLVWFP